ncbi:MAG: MerR family transcriptional regulator [Solobacterium sp.]|nr:MerR family transcriptional regulator [Solobacterium sp.]
MKINEIEKQLKLTKDNIRYYESEGLLEVKRDQNGYRNYSEENVETLKKIIVFRKVGIPIAGIRRLLRNEITLNEALSETIEDLNRQMDDLAGAIRLCKKMQADGLKTDQFDPDIYLNEISEMEQKGNRFAELSKDVLNYSSELVRDSFGHFQFFFPIFKPLLRKQKKKGSPLLAVIFLILLILVGGSTCLQASMRNNMDDRPYFLIGMATFAVIIVIWIILRNIVYFLSQRSAERERLIMVTGSILSALVSVLLLITAVFHWSHIWMFRDYTDPPVFLDPLTDSVQIMTDEEMPSPDNDFEYKDYCNEYYVTDPAYIQKLRSLIGTSRPTGRWSLTENDLMLYNAKKLTRSTDPYLQICLATEETNRTTFFYLYKDEDQWLLDEPNYGVFEASDALVSHVMDYKNHTVLHEGIIEGYRKIFEYDPAEIHHDPHYADDTYDLYWYLELTDRETGEDVTQQFIEKYRSDYENQNYSVIREALESVKESWRYEYVHPKNSD